MGMGLTNCRRMGNHACKIVITRNLRAVVNMTENALASSFPDGPGVAVGVLGVVDGGKETELKW
jgi:hypothetical protein